MRNVSHRLEYLNTWFPTGGAIWEGLCGLVLLEEVCDWWRALRASSLTPLPVFSASCLWLRMWILFPTVFNIPAAAKLSHHDRFLLFWNCKTSVIISSVNFCSWCFITAAEKLCATIPLVRRIFFPFGLWDCLHASWNCSFWCFSITFSLATLV